MRTLLTLFTVLTTVVVAADTPLDRWAAAAGGRDRLTELRSIYREATIDVGGHSGSIRAWHTADGKYRKEETIGPLSSIEAFDGFTLERELHRTTGDPRYDAVIRFTKTLLDVPMDNALFSLATDGPRQ